MLYWLYQQLSADGYVSFLNLLKYQTFRTGMALFTAQLVVVAMGSRFIRWMQAKQGKGQPIRADGIERHVVEKAGTPTMGGVMILAGLLVGTLLWSDLTNVYVWAVILVTAGYGVLGFTDDYAKVTKQTTDGVSGKVRLLMEAAIALAAVALMVVFGTNPPETPNLSTSVAFPIFKELLLPMGWFYLAFGAFIIVGAANAVNFTDGLDGLAAGSMAMVLGSYVLISFWQFRYACETKQVAGCYDVRDPLDLALIAVAAGGACLGFLWWNAAPAKIFMGDTGSLMLGGLLAGLSITTRTELLAVVLGALFVAEMVSVVIQIAVFRSTGRRVFRMAPFHHHFELSGWAETTVIIRFWLLTAISCGLGLVLFYAEFLGSGAVG